MYKFLEDNNIIISFVGVVLTSVGLVISIITLVYAGSIKNAVKKANSEVLFNYKVDDILKKLQAYNKEFISISENIDERDAKNMLNSLKSTLTILQPIIPLEHKTKCNLAIKKSKKGYNTTFIKSNSLTKRKWYKGYIDIDYMWSVYHDVNNLIDALQDIKINKNILK